MKNITQQSTKKDDKGIAILFSLIMLVTFFFIGFGFSSIVSSAGRSASARAVPAEAAAIAIHKVQSEAIYALDRLHNPLLDFGAFSNTPFSVGSSSGSLPGWGTGGAISEDINNDGSNDSYEYTIYNRDLLDINYLDETPPTVTEGMLSNEISLENIGGDDFRTQHRNWSTDKPWETMTHLIDNTTATLTALQKTIAIENFIVGTKSVKVEGTAGRYDLAAVGSTTNFPSFKASIPWLTNNNDQMAANVKDFCDTDNKATTDNNTYCGNERVPYINTVGVRVQNNTQVNAQTELNFQFTVKTVNMFAGVLSWGSRSGVNGILNIDAEVSFERQGSNYTVDCSLLEPIDLTNTAEGYHMVVTGTKSVTVSKPSVNATGKIDKITVKIKKVTLYGAPGIVWDIAKLDSTSEIEPNIQSGFYATYQWEVSDPRANFKNVNWQKRSSWDSGQNYPAGGVSDTVANNSNYNPGTWADTEDPISKPWQLSTAFMPENGVTDLAQLGMVSRGEKGKTLNLVDYNMSSPTLFNQSNYLPSGNLGLSNSNTFNGGDRALLDFVFLNNDGSPYEQHGVINPNTLSTTVIETLLKNIAPSIGGSKTTSTPSQLVELAKRFPTIYGNTAFKYGDFYDNNSDTMLRNPKTYGFPFSIKHPLGNVAPLNTLTDAQREYLVIHSMRLVSPKYSYFTIKGSVDIDNGGTSNFSTFIRCDNDPSLSNANDKYTIIRQTLK